MGWGLVMVAWGAAEDSWEIATGGLKPTVENPHRACTSDKTEEVRAFKSTLTCSSACACRLDLSPCCEPCCRGERPSVRRASYRAKVGTSGSAPSGAASALALG